MCRSQVQCHLAFTMATVAGLMPPRLPLLVATTTPGRSAAAADTPAAPSAAAIAAAAGSADACTAAAPDTAVAGTAAAGTAAVVPLGGIFGSPFLSFGAVPSRCPPHCHASPHSRRWRFGRAHSPLAHILLRLMKLLQHHTLNVWVNRYS